ncbi:ATP-binding protein [Roseofilum reptotaenium CS-1145]|uniref:histidine kinase n=1 Tax=Roseofilum reptotaenium AO1-A TaxID=1925591 RepID=A0A1L9QKW5_9CYAN|nr:ATP-binding protein [Roseofilum reptotaenium]MDB9515525.1 ATP-binding protein [Roseofilum reptotaenium CS-1145]OJJ18141.1 two-component sensor histidine kinase [Roseofilum reptotaenium AO1-A]
MLIKNLGHRFKFKFNSLQFRLTLGLAIVSGIGLGSVAIATGLKMQQQLVLTHKQNIEYIAERLPNDIKIYSQRFSQRETLEMVIQDVSAENIFLWIQAPDGEIIARSPNLQRSLYPENADLLNISNAPIQPEVYPYKGRYLVLCAGPLRANEQHLGKLYLAQDITSEQKMLLEMLRNLIGVSVFALLLIVIMMAVYIRRSLDPVRKISEYAVKISAQDLGEVSLSLDPAPSELQELTKTLDLMLSRLSESWEHQRQFVSNVSHELRTPLTIVHGYLQSTLRRGKNLTEPQREALETAAGEADRTIQLLQDLLELARTDNGHIHFELDKISLTDLVLEVVDMAQQYSNRSIELDLGEWPVEIKGDRNRLKQVLLNLIDNAVKYSDPDTVITVKLDKESDRVCLQVCDRGEGIPLAHQARIFERFYRVDDARARSTGGTGLGLSIVKTLIEGMGGRVNVVSKLGEGSTFTISLPIH